MKVLVIPDVHLKPWMFKRASEIVKEQNIEQTVCLMDIADDWNQERNIRLYEDSYDAAIAFAKEYPDSLWCFGNHDLSYVWKMLESGYSFNAEPIVPGKLVELSDALSDRDNITIIHRIDNVVFMHGGLTKFFVENYVKERDTIDDIVFSINRMHKAELWNNDSPLWFRPQYSNAEMYDADGIIQVIGHTPVEKLERKGNIVACDVFSTYKDGAPIGTQEFLIIDTISGEFFGMK